MVCPECSSNETIKDSGQVFCKKCGLELDDVIVSQGRARKSVVKLQKIKIKIDPKKELFALKLGLKNNKLHKNWEQYLGFKVSSGYLKTELKEKAQEFIQKAFKKNNELLINSKTRIESNWANINNKFFIEVEDLLKLKWPVDSFDCYLSLCAKYGFHNSSKNFIIVQQSLDKLSNYVIAHELFYILFRNYVNRFFKEKYGDNENELSRIVVTFVLLAHPKIKTCFPEMKFTFDMFTSEHKDLAKKLWPLWQEMKSFKEFMISSYKILNIEKTWVSY